MRRLFRCLLLLLLVSPVLASPTVRVLLEEVDGAVKVMMPGPHRGYVDGNLRFQTALALSWPLVARNGKLFSDGREIGRSFTLEPLEGFVSWRGRRYRGSLRLVAAAGAIRVINVVALEDYLKGVVPAEMQASWPMEALKAQAVAARTFALVSLSPGADYDLCATMDCQVYRGVAAEHPRSDQAVRETRGVVLTYGGALARTYYHAESGGFLASSAEVWGLTLPYLQARSDVGDDGPYSRWRVEIDPRLAARTLRDYGVSVGLVRSLRVLAASESGRVQRLQIRGSRGSVVFEGRALVALLRSWDLKSSRFHMVGALIAEGSGWGHGVGMSQYGARSLARANYSYGQILSFYYPATELQLLAYARSG